MTRSITVKGISIQVTNDFDEKDPDQMEALEGWADHLASRAAETANTAR